MVNKEDLDHILNHTAGLWEELRGQSIFITGGTGFFGRWLLESFVYANDQLSLGAKVAMLTRNPESFRSKAPHLASAIQVFQGDVRNFAFPKGDFPFIIHAANEDFETMVEGTRRTLEFATTHGTCKFLLISSGAVYGNSPPLNVSEDYAGANRLEPIDSYAEAKRIAESLCFGPFECKVARCFTFVGPYLPPHYAVSDFIRDSLKGGPIVVISDGSPLRSYLYAADLVIWLWTILLKGKRRIYNVGSDMGIKISDLAELVRQIVNPSLDMIIGDRATLVRQQYVPSIECARNELALETWTSLEQAIEKTFCFKR